MDGSAVGVDLGGTKLQVCVEGRHHRFPTGPRCSPAEIESNIRSVMALMPSPPSCLGIAVPGLIDEDGAVTESDVLPEIVAWNPRRSFGKECPTVVLNDADAALIGTRATLDSDACVVVVLAGTAIGSAVSDHGHRLRGTRGWAGELGAIPICGARGAMSLNEAAGGASLLRRLSRSPTEVVQAAEAGDAEIVNELRSAGTALGEALASCINLFNPQHLMLGGGTLRFPGYQAAALQAAKRWSIPQLFEVCVIRIAPEDGSWVCDGASRSALAFLQSRGHAQ